MRNAWNSESILPEEEGMQFEIFLLTSWDSLACKTVETGSGFEGEGLSHCCGLWEWGADRRLYFYIDEMAPRGFPGPSFV